MPDDGAQPVSRAQTAGGRFFKMEYSPLNNRRTLGSAGGAMSGGGGRRRMTLQAPKPGEDLDSSGVAATHTVGSASVQKMKQLEDFLQAFPVEAPFHRSEKQEEDDGHNLFSATKRTLRGAGATQTTQGGATSGGVAASLNKEALARRQKLEPYLQAADRANGRIRVENEMLETLAQIEQEHCVDNDEKYSEAIAQLRAEVEFAQTYREDSSEALGNIDERIAGIRSLISELVSTAERTTQQEQEAVRSAFQRQLEEEKAQLELVRESGKNTTHEWKLKNAALQEDLERIMFTTQDTYEKLSLLQAESQRLRVEFSAQAGDAELLEVEYRKVFTHHQRLKDRLHTLETEMATRAVRAELPCSNDDGSGRPHSTSVAGLQGELLLATEAARRSVSAHSASPMNDSGVVTQHDFQVALKKTQLLLEAEAANLKSVREAHLETLRQRTELEVFLRQQIVRHKIGKLGQQKATDLKAAARDYVKGVGGATQSADGARVICGLDGGAPVAFDVEDRKAIIDGLLGHSRVLQLLFDDDIAEQKRPGTGSFMKAGVRSTDADMRQGTSFSRCGDAGAALPDPHSLVDGVANPRTHEERQLSALYDQWQEWTVRANSEVFPQVAGDSRRR